MLFSGIVELATISRERESSQTGKNHRVNPRQHGNYRDGGRLNVEAGLLESDNNK